MQTTNTSLQEFHHWLETRKANARDFFGGHESEAIDTWSRINELRTKLVVKSINGELTQEEEALLFALQRYTELFLHACLELKEKASKSKSHEDKR